MANKSRRMRNRSARKGREPLHHWEHPEKWSKAASDASISNPREKKETRERGKSAPAHEDMVKKEPLIQVVPASFLRNLRQKIGI